jgi:hypothetical protein
MTALPALREVLKDPAVVDVLGGDLAGRVQQKVIAKFWGKGGKPNPLLRESVTRKLELLRGELAGPNPAPLERLLVERVVTCWLQLHFLELLHAGQDNLSLAQMTCWERCVDRAQNRYLSAIRALALVRKLALPVLALPNAVLSPVPAPALPVPAALERRLSGAAAPGTNGTPRNGYSNLCADPGPR